MTGKLEKVERSEVATDLVPDTLGGRLVSLRQLRTSRCFQRSKDGPRGAGDLPLAGVADSPRRKFH
jgi:hypothetical protein